MVSGTTLKGLIHLNDTLLLGPDSLGAFYPFPVKSIHRKRMPVKEVRGGQTASFSLKKVNQISVLFFVKSRNYVELFLYMYTVGERCNR